MGWISSVDTFALFAFSLPTSHDVHITCCIFSLEYNDVKSCFVVSPVCTYVIFPACLSVLPWRQTPLHSARHSVPAGVRKKLHTSMCLSSRLGSSGRRRPLGAEQREGRRLFFSPFFFFYKCNNGDEAPDLWSEYEMGGACPARQASYWEKRRTEGKKQFKREKNYKIRDMRQQLTDIQSTARKHPNRVN